MMDRKIAKWMNLAALLLFAAAVFQIADDRLLLGVIFFGAAACFSFAAGSYQKRELAGKQYNERMNEVQNHAEY